MTGPLKIIARDAEDLTVVSACLQDALIPLNEMRYLPQERRFIMVANRFRWERAAKGGDVPAPEVRSRALSLGAFRVLSKPFDMQDMSAAVVAAWRSLGTT